MHLYRFAASSSSLHRRPAPQSGRAVLLGIIDDLQILALERPRMLPLVAACVRKLTQPFRDRAFDGAESSGTAR